jgi:hypothetical protein
MTLWVLLLAFQAGYLWYLDDRLSYASDPHAEADTLRAAEGYVADGLAAHHGLARILYGTRFPGEGTVKDHVDAQGQVPAKYHRGFPDEMADRNQWANTHYPPGADLINGVQARLFGVDPIWRLRLLPVVVGFLGLAFFFRTVSLLWGAERGVLIALAVAVLPSVSLWLPTLHHESYAFALVLIQTSLLLRGLWGMGRPGAWLAALLFLIGFVQGWLSWDHFFLVSLLAVPWWLLRRAEGENPPLRWLLWMMAAPAAGYALAHILHFWEVAAELHGWQAALGELGRTGVERAGLSGAGATDLAKTSRLGYTAKAIYLYARYSLKPNGNLMFGPFFDIMLMLALPVALFSRANLTLTPGKGKRGLQVILAWPGSRSPLPALVAALLVSAAWLIALPQHVVGNSHYTVRHMTMFYICMTVVVARSLQIRQED